MNDVGARSVDCSWFLCKQQVYVSCLLSFTHVKTTGCVCEINFKMLVSKMLPRGKCTIELYAEIISNLFLNQNLIVIQKCVIRVPHVSQLKIRGVNISFQFFGLWDQ